MANICDLQIEIVGPSEILIELAGRVLEHADGAPEPDDDEIEPGLDLLGALDPLPEGAEPNSYWGDRWGTVAGNLDGPGLDEGEQLLHLTYWCQSAWTPPMLGLDRVAARYPDLMLTLVYAETTLGFAGTAVWVDGKRVLDCYWMNGWKAGDSGSGAAAIS